MGRYGLDSNVLFALVALSHLSVIPMILYGSWAHYACSIVIYCLFFGWGISMTFHRLLAHHSWNAPTGFKQIGILFGALCLQGSSLAWIAMHREHHQYADTSKDPHSPNPHFFRAHFLTMFHMPSMRYALDHRKDRWQLFVHKHYWTIILLYILGIFLSLGPFGLVYMFLFPAFLSWHAAGFVNSIAHRSGYRNFATADNSRNVWWLSFLNFGEGWHNNHHADPKNAQFGLRWWEFDLSGLLIALLGSKQPALKRNEASGTPFVIPDP